MLPHALNCIHQAKAQGGKRALVTADALDSVQSYNPNTAILPDNEEIPHTASVLEPSSLAEPSRLPGLLSVCSSLYDRKEKPKGGIDASKTQDQAKKTEEEKWM
jgi:hypothetical protein